MKIAIILPHFYPYVGGGETMFYDVARGMAARGHEVRVVAEKVDEEHSGHKVIDGIHVWYCPWKSMFGHPFPRTKDIERHIRWCDVVHTSIFTTAPVVSRLAKKYHKPSVLSVYEVRGFKWFWSDVFHRAMIYFAVEQFSCRQKFDVYHAISEATKRDFRKYIGHKDVRRVYLADEMGKDALGTDMTFSLRDYFEIGDEKVFLYYGRAGKTKGVHIYAQAIRYLRQRGVDLHKVRFCFLLGKEPAGPRAEFVEKIEKWGLSDVVRIRDSVTREELTACIAQADCVVVPSLTEGFGFSALEACQIGTPLIYSDGGSLPEVAYGRCRSFRNRNASHLAGRLAAVIREDPRAFRKVPEKHFTDEEMLGSLEEIYYEISQKAASGDTFELY
ncbi:MAG: glycosyltransferase family 4 protein [Lachnospiraceae bacterium]|nr:glycosyltransferase family 4 protein [Lachnospiraceae bacterium]